MKEGMAPIDAIPDEVLVEIFNIHVWGNLDALQRVLRVCRRWHAVAMGRTSLWGRILLAVPQAPNGSPILTSQLLCESGRSLLRTIERTKKSPFELTIYVDKAAHSHGDLSHFLWDGWIAVQRSISQRCRTLSFLGAIGMLPVLAFKEFAALERLEIDSYSARNGPGIERQPLVHNKEIGVILSIANRSSTKLSQLILKTVGTVPINAYPKLFSRLRSLYIHSTDLVILEEDDLTEARALECMHLQSDIYRPQSIPLPTDPLPTLRSLWITIRTFETLNLGNLSNLSQLYLKTGTELSVPYTLPSLIHLTLDGPWLLLKGLAAPLLRTLVLRDAGIDLVSSLDAVMSSNIIPRFLEIDASGAKRYGSFFPQFFSVLPGKWPNIEALRITYYHSDILDLNEILVKALLNETTSIYSNLRQLVVLSVAPPSTTNVMTASEEQTLRKFVDGRKEDGILERVRFGFCSTPASVQMPTKDEAMEWVDVFRAKDFHALDHRYGAICIACGSDA